MAFDPRTQQHGSGSTRHQQRVVHPPGSRYSLTQTSPCKPIISEVLPHRLFISNIEGTADTAHLQVYRSFYFIISLSLFLISHWVLLMFFQL